MIDEPELSKEWKRVFAERRAAEEARRKTLVEEFDRSGMSKAAFCRQHDISPYWLNKYIEQVHPPPPHPPISFAQIVQENMDREKEAQLQRRLGLKVIDSGYKAWASKLHPDHGGSPEEMARLNRVRDILKRAV